MKLLNDEIHKCAKCEIFPCSIQDEVVSNLCKDCPIVCCRSQLITLLPCEINHFENGEIPNTLKMKEDGWCFYYDNKIGCKVHLNKPIICRISSCGFIRRGKIIQFKPVI